MDNPVSRSFRNNEDIYGEATSATSPFFTPMRASAPNPRPRPKLEASSNSMPSCHGVTLVSVHELPDRLRSIFPFPAFNAMQSRCFIPAYKTDDNLVVSAPTASGKTTVLELAICRILPKVDATNAKIIYLGPTKALCDERYEDWSARFRQLGISCGLVTGDSDGHQSSTLQRSQLIITTPEKWDSITRKLQDQDKLMKLVQVMMIDEIHILNQERGATIEAVVSRMKSMKIPVRFIALSATVPNAIDVATWLGRHHKKYDAPAHLEIFGEEYRPSKLLKFVHSIPRSAEVSDWCLDKKCNDVLPDIIREHSANKPVLIFCPTRKSAQETATKLAEYWNTKEKLWCGRNSALPLDSKASKDLSITGIACHHAGLLPEQREIIEQAFLNGEISIICCTSTLAVGVNLPCYLAIIKNTVQYKNGTGLIEYSDLDIMQMLGRAGRPQFGDHGRGVIITKSNKAQKYESLLRGTEPLESYLHLNLNEHLNAEIVIGTIRSLRDAKLWLASTFLYVRFQQNRSHYRIEGLPEGASFEQQLEHLCNTSLDALRASDILHSDTFDSTPFGELMARQYICLGTMATFRALPRNAKVVDILVILAKAEELHEVKLRPGETAFYNEISKWPGLKYSIDCTDKHERKRILLMQAELGSIPCPTRAECMSILAQYRQDVAVIFNSVHRLIRCLVDTRRLLGDGISVRSGLEVSRSLAARAWDNSPMIFKQLPKVGLATVLKLQQLRIRSMTDLKSVAVEKLDRCRPDISLFGTKLLAEVEKFPMLRVSARILGLSRSGGLPVVRCKAEIGFLNATIPRYFGSRRIFIHFLVIRSDGLLIDLKQITSFNSKDMVQKFSVKLESYGQVILCYVSCDELAGTLQEATIDPRIPEDRFPAIATTRADTEPNTNDREFEDDDLLDEDFLNAETGEFVPIDSIVSEPLPSSAVERSQNGNARSLIAHKPQHAVCSTILESPRRCNKTSQRFTGFSSDTELGVDDFGSVGQSHKTSKKRKQSFGSNSICKKTRFEDVNRTTTTKTQQAAYALFDEDEPATIVDGPANHANKIEQASLATMHKEIAQASQDLAEYRPFKDMDGVDLDFMALFAGH